MAGDKSQKRKIIEIISSSSEDDDTEAISSSTSCDDDDYDESDWNSENERDDEYEERDEDDDESMCDKVFRFIREGIDLQELKLVECKAYLRRHGLRLSGTKEECIDRIKEHWSFDKMKRRGYLLGRRTVAGRIVKESYGEARQQHTFTVEVLWSRGAKKLAPLFPLLVKGRNLYKLKTFRQRWKNEKERLEVLAEKHERGAAARSIRAKRKQIVVTKTSKSRTCKRAKQFKRFRQSDPSGRTESMHMKKQRISEHDKALTGNSKWSHQNFYQNQASGSKQMKDRRGHESLNFSNHVGESAYLHSSYPSQSFNHFASDVPPREMHRFPSHGGFATTARFPYSHSHMSGGLIHPAFSHSGRAYKSIDFNHFSCPMDFHHSFHSLPTDTRRWS